jgi:CHAD domain-containing protein
MKRVEPGTKLRDAARILCGARLAIVRAFEDLIAAERSVEGVHDMRVATRRLRAALALLHGKAVDARGVKALAAALGEVRERHVQRAWLEEVAPDLAVVVARELPAAERALLVGLHEWTSRAVPRLVLALARAAPRGKLDGKRVRHRIAARFAEVATHLDAIDPRRLDGERAHELRLAVKKLRYQLEVLVPVRGKRVDRVIATLVALQEALGELHDADVHLALLARLGAPAKLSRQLRQERRIYARAVAAEIARWQAEGIVEKLARRI